MMLRFALSKIPGIVTNNPRSRTSRGLKKRAPRFHRGAVESCYGMIGPLRLDGHGGGFRPGGAAGADFADLEARETPDRNIFTQLGDRLSNHLADRYTFVLNVMLVVEAVFLIELFHVTGHDFLDHRFRFSGSHCLRPVNFALFFEHLRSHFLAPHVPRIERRHMHGDVVRELLESIRARHEIGFAVQFHEHTNLAARVNIAAHEPLAGFALRFLRRSRLAFLAQDADGFFDVAPGFHERRAAVTESRVGPLAQFFYELCWDLHSWLLCTHPFFSSFSIRCFEFSYSRPLFAKRPAPMRSERASSFSHSRGWLTSLPHQEGRSPRRSPPGLPRGLPRSRLLASRTVRKRWCPRTPRRPPEPGLPPISVRPPATAGTRCGLRARSPRSSS